MSSPPSPSHGHRIERIGGSFAVPDDPIVPFIEGDGIGPDLWAASVRVFDAAVERCYGGKRRIHWLEILAGEKAQARVGSYFPKETLGAIARHRIAIKGPLTTPVGGGMRSLNVALRQELDLYACIRPVRYFEGVPSPLKRPEDVNVVVFRENTEDVYAGIEWKAGSPEARRVCEFLAREMGARIALDSGVGVKPMTEKGSKRLVRMALRYALENRRTSVTLVHKGNIMKYTEGAFREWGYEVARSEFGSQTLTEDEVAKSHGGVAPAGKVVIKDRIADSMFQQLLLRPAEYDVLATPNLNGDYLSDAAIAQVGGLGLAPGANVGDEAGVFEATHGTAPKYAGQDKSNPGSVILSGCLMLEFMGWREAAAAITAALAETIKQRRVTYDLERQMAGARLLRCSEFASAIIENLKASGERA